MIDCHDYPENGGGPCGPYGIYQDKAQAEEAAKALAAEWVEDEEQEEADYYTGYVLEFELK
jgi:hypothetical protein